MTPKFKYDPEQHCLREVLQTPDKTCHEHTQFNTPEKFRQELERRRSSRRVIPCAPGSKWPEGELMQYIHFRIMVSYKPFRRVLHLAFPITTQPRIYTQAEAEEIWNAGFNRAVFECSPHNGKQPDKQQYFKTRFNVELTPQTS